MTKMILFLMALTFSQLAIAQKKIPLVDLNPEEINLLENGHLIQKIKEIEGSSWPEITDYLLVEADALESMAIFSALDYQHEYVPNLLKSKPIKHLSALEVLTEYEMHVPFPLSNARYIHGSIVHQYDSDFELTWYMVESTSTEIVLGSAYFSPYKIKEKISTLFRYRSYIKPKSIFGLIVRKRMLDDVKKSILATRAHIEKLKHEHSPVLTKYSKFITDALNGVLVYKNSILKE